MFSDYLIIDKSSELYKFSDLKNDRIEIIDSSLIELNRIRKIFKLILLSLVRLFSPKLSRYIHSTIYQDLKINRDFYKSINAVRGGDFIVFVNPTICIFEEIFYLQNKGVKVNVFFADPIIRCGFNHKDIKKFKENNIKIFSYSKKDQKEYQVYFLPCFIPKSIEKIDTEYDAVYVGSFSFFRLYYYFRFKIFEIIYKKKILFLLVLNSKILRTLTLNAFSDRIDPKEYINFCSKAKAIIDITEPDADGWNPRISIACELNSTIISNKNYFEECVSINSFNAIKNALDKNNCSWDNENIMYFPEWYEHIRK